MNYRDIEEELPITKKMKYFWKYVYIYIYHPKCLFFNLGFNLDKSSILKFSLFTTVLNSSYIFLGTNVKFYYKLTANLFLLYEVLAIKFFFNNGSLAKSSLGLFNIFFKKPPFWEALLATKALYLGYKTYRFNLRVNFYYNEFKFFYGGLLNYDIYFNLLYSTFLWFNPVIIFFNILYSGLCYNTLKPLYYSSRSVIDFTNGVYNFINSTNTLIFTYYPPVPVALGLSNLYI